MITKRKLLVVDVKVCIRGGSVHYNDLRLPLGNGSKERDVWGCFLALIAIANGYAKGLAVGVAED